MAPVFLQKVFRGHNPRHIFTTEPILFLFVMAIFMSFPNMQALLRSKICLKHFNKTLCNNLQNHTTEQDMVQTETSHWILYLQISFTLPAILVAPLLGTWCDKISHKLVLILSVTGSLMNQVVFALNAMFFEASLGYLFIGSLFGAVSGGFAAVLLGCFSYITILAQDEKMRTIRLGILEAVLLFGSAIGLGASGAMREGTSFQAVFIFTSILLLIALMYTIFWLEEPPITRPSKPEGQSWARYLFQIQYVKEPFIVTFKKRPGRKRCVILLCMFIFMLVLVMIGGDGDITYLYTLYVIPNWTQTLYGFYLMMNQLVSGITLLILVPICKKRWKMKDFTLGMMGLLSRLCSNMMLAFTNSVGMIFTVPVLNALQGFFGTAVRATLAKMVERDEQGKLFSLVASVQAGGILLASVIYNSIYPLTLSWFPGFCFILSSIFIVISMGLWLIVDWNTKLTEPEIYETFDEPGNIIEIDHQPVDRRRFSMIILPDNLPSDGIVQAVDTTV